jgi:hypothetical protein
LLLFSRQLESYSGCCCLWIYLSVISPVFWTTFNVSVLMLMSLIHFDLILVQWGQQGSFNISVLHVDMKFYRQRILKPLSKITWL